MGTQKEEIRFQNGRVCEKQGACLYPLDIMDMTRPGYGSGVFRALTGESWEEVLLNNWCRA